MYAFNQAYLDDTQRFRFLWRYHKLHVYNLATIFLVSIDRLMNADTHIYLFIDTDIVRLTNYPGVGQP